MTTETPYPRFEQSGGYATVLQSGVIKDARRIAIDTARRRPSVTVVF